MPPELLVLVPPEEEVLDEDEVLELVDEEPLVDPPEEPEEDEPEDDEPLLDEPLEVAPPEVLP